MARHRLHAGRMEGRGVTRRRLLSVGACALCAAGIGARSWWLGEHGPQKPPEQRHSMGEWVSLEGAFLQTRLKEKTQGYSVRVTGAEVLSYNEFVAMYSNDESEPIEGLDEKSIVCVALNLKNEGSDGFLAVGVMYLVPARRNEFFISDNELLVSTEEKMRSGNNPGLSVNIRQGTEYTIHLAYVHQGGTTDYEGQQIQEAYLEPIEDRSFELVVANSPIRHVIEVQA